MRKTSPGMLIILLIYGHAVAGENCAAAAAVATATTMHLPKVRVCVCVFFWCGEGSGKVYGGCVN